MIFISVDLPAPFSPISAWTWPRLRRNDTSSSASTPGKALRTFETSSRYSAPGMAPLCLTISAVEGLMVAMALRPILTFGVVFFRLRQSYTNLTRDDPEALGGGRLRAPSPRRKGPARRRGIEETQFFFVN